MLEDGSKSESVVTRDVKLDPTSSADSSEKDGSIVSVKEAFKKKERMFFGGLPPGLDFFEAQVGGK